MHYGYNFEEVKQKVFSALSENYAGLSGIELASRTKINRMTLTKYLNLMLTQGLIRKKKIGTVNVWHLDKDAPPIEFPINIRDLQQKFLDCLLQGNESQATNIISNLLFSTISKERIIFDIILPTLNILNDMYDRGKISESEKLLVSNSALDLVLMTKFVSVTDTPRLRAYSIIVSGSDEATYLARIASVTLHLMGWHSLYLGNVENKIDPFFDIDIQRLISKKLKNVNGLSTVIIFSFNANTLKFLSNTVNSLRNKIENNLQIAVYTNNDLLKVSHEMDVDYITTELRALIEWAKDEYRKTLS